MMKEASEPGLSNLETTAILDFRHVAVSQLAESLIRPGQTNRNLLQEAYRQIVQNVRPVYSVDEWQATSVTLENGEGSCSQRMALLEAVARAAGIATRVRAIYVKGDFWYPRFRLTRWLMPHKILLLWPQFFLEGTWVDFDEICASIGQLAAAAPPGFTNDGESLFEAVQSKPVDLLGKTCGLACARPEYDLSRFVLQDAGFFDTRDEAFKRLGSFQSTLRGRLFEVVFGGRKSC